MWVDRIMTVIGISKRKVNVFVMILRGTRMKHAVLRAISFFGLCLGLYVFVLPVTLKGGGYICQFRAK